MQSILKKHQIEDLGEGPPSYVPAVAAQPGVPSASSPPGATAVRPARRAELLKVDGVVYAIEVRCACGTATVIELEYPKAQGAA